MESRAGVGSGNVAYSVAQVAGSGGVCGEGVVDGGAGVRMWNYFQPSGSICSLSGGESSFSISASEMNALSEIPRSAAPALER